MRMVPQSNFWKVFLINFVSFSTIIPLIIEFHELRMTISSNNSASSIRDTWHRHHQRTLSLFNYSLDPAFPFFFCLCSPSHWLALRCDDLELSFAPRLPSDYYTVVPMSLFNWFGTKIKNGCNSASAWFGFTSILQSWSNAQKFIPFFKIHNIMFLCIHLQEVTTLKENALLNHKFLVYSEWVTTLVRLSSW